MRAMASANRFTPDIFKGPPSKSEGPSACLNPSFAASLRRESIRLTPRMSPERLISPNTTQSWGRGNVQSRGGKGCSGCEIRSWFVDAKPACDVQINVSIAQANTASGFQDRQDHGKSS